MALHTLFLGYAEPLVCHLSNGDDSSYCGEDLMKCGPSGAGTDHTQGAFMVTHISGHLGWWQRRRGSQERTGVIKGLDPRAPICGTQAPSGDGSDLGEGFTAKAVSHRSVMLYTLTQ